MADDDKKNEKKNDGWLAGWMGRLATKIEKDLDITGYKGKVSAKALRGPVVSVVVKGAESDVTAMKDARKQLDTIIDESVKTEMKGYDGFKHKVTAANKGDDLVVSCEIIFP